MKKKLYQALASRVTAMKSCERRGKQEWKSRHEAAITALVREYLPSGSGFDCGTTIDIDKSDGRRVLCFHTSFHRMNDCGMYVEWCDYTVKAVADLLCGFVVNARGRDINDLRVYVEESFRGALDQEVDD